ncbi:MAG: hypothetical protein ACI9G1_006048 [Pirellulaceae bacterium]
MAISHKLEQVGGRIDKPGQLITAAADSSAAQQREEQQIDTKISTAANNLFQSLASHCQSPPANEGRSHSQGFENAANENAADETVADETVADETVAETLPSVDAKEESFATDEPASASKRPRKQLGLFSYLFRVAFFIIVPPIYAVMCVLWHHYEMMVVFVFVLCFYGLMGKIDFDAKWITWLKKVPVLGRAFFSASVLSTFYERHAPAPFAYYLFYPITCLFGAVHSSVRRRELFLYGQIIGIFLLVIAGKQVFEFGSVYLPYLGVVDVFSFLTKISVLMVLTTVVFLVPMITTSFELRMTGQTKKLRYIALSGLVVSVPVFLMGLISETAFPTSVSLPADVLLDLRFERSQFRTDLSTISRMFLEYHIDEAKELPVIGSVSENPILTPRYQKVIRNVVVHDEVLAFYVFNLPGDDGKTWLAIGRGLYPDQARKQLLFVCSPDHEFHTAWPEQAEQVHNFVHDLSHEPWEDITFREQHIRQFQKLRFARSRLRSVTDSSPGALAAAAEDTPSKDTPSEDTSLR